MKMCKSFQKKIIAYIHGELSESQAEAVKNHLESCEVCRAEYELHAATLDVLGEALETAPAAERLRAWNPVARMAAERQVTLADVWYSLQFRSIVAAGAVAAVFILISGGVVVFTNRQVNKPTVAVTVDEDLLNANDPNDRVAVKPSGRIPDFVPPSLTGLTPDQDNLTYSEFAHSYASLDNLQDSTLYGSARVYNAVVAENSFKSALESPLSTFALDLDRASYADVRRFLDNDLLPPPELVRPEEMVNYFAYDYPQPEGDDPFAIALEVGQCPWNEAHQLAMIGLRSADVDVAGLPPNNIVFLLDVSGSMNTPEKLPLLKGAMRLMVEQLRPEDRLSIVTCAGAAGVVLEPTADKRKINEAIDLLDAAGNAGQGVGFEEAYRVAQKAFVDGGNNRILLATDGDFSVPGMSEGELVRLVERQQEAGLFLSVLGFCSEDTEDSRITQLADAGRGSCAYVSDILSARKMLVNEMGAMLATVAEGVNVQVEFNPAQVKAYRLIGYDNRSIGRVSAKNSVVGEDYSAGHMVTALYELISAVSDKPPSGEELKYQRTELISSEELFTVKLQYTLPEQNMTKQLIRSISPDEVAAVPSDDFCFAGEVAEFALLLKKSAYRADADYDRVIERARAVSEQDSVGYRSEFIRLVEKARVLDNSARE
ncbi:MAG: von Willebrand factor type A domain-containing protein [Pontiellaceae bacterium]|nr:von Willebrand factor type A domain-containing protein [Pontiellaceae bacterium]